MALAADSSVKQENAGVVMKKRGSKKGEKPKALVFIALFPAPA